MAVMLRHGGESHNMRPDRVYRTSVLSPIAGYAPGADVQAVAAAFTAPFGPNGLSGLGAGSGGRLATWWANLKARIAAKKQAVVARAAGVSAPPGPAYQNAQQIAPQIATQMQMLAALAPTHGGGPYAAAMDAATRRWATYYIAG